MLLSLKLSKQPLFYPYGNSVYCVMVLFQTEICSGLNINWAIVQIRQV
jgi:hypothetical protein